MTPYDQVAEIRSIIAGFYGVEPQQAGGKILDLGIEIWREAYRHGREAGMMGTGYYAEIKRVECERDEADAVVKRLCDWITGSRELGGLGVKPTWGDDTIRCLSRHAPAKGEGE